MKKTQFMTQMLLPGVVTAVDHEVRTSGPETAGLQPAYEARLNECQRYRTLAQAERALDQDSRRIIWKVWFHPDISNGTALYEEALTPKL